MRDEVNRRPEAEGASMDAQRAVDGGAPAARSGRHQSRRRRRAIARESKVAAASTRLIPRVGIFVSTRQPTGLAAKSLVWGNYPA